MDDAVVLHPVSEVVGGEEPLAVRREQPWPPILVKPGSQALADRRGGGGGAAARGDGEMGGKSWGKSLKKRVEC